MRTRHTDVDRTSVESEAVDENDEEPQIEPRQEGTFKGIPTKSLRGALEALGCLVDEARLEVRPDGSLYVKAVDAAHVAMVEVTFPRHGFRQVEGDRGFIAGLSVEKALQKVKAFGKRQGEEASLSVSIGGGPEADKGLTLEKDRMKRFVAGVDPKPLSEPSIPDLGLDARATVEAPKSLYDFIRYAKDTADHVRLTIDEGEGLAFTAQGDRDTDTWVSPTDESRARGEARSLYSNEYLKDILQVAKLYSDTVHVETSTDYPIRLSFSVGPVDVSYLVAPRIES